MRAGIYIPLLTLLLSTYCTKVEKIYVPVPENQNQEIQIKQEQNLEKLEQESAIIRIKQQEAAAERKRMEALKGLDEAQDPYSRINFAQRYFYAMPYQTVKAPELRRQMHKFQALESFFSSQFLRFTTLVGGFRMKGHDPANFNQLAALGVMMHVIHPEQREFRETPISFLDLVKELVTAHFRLHECAECLVEDFPLYIRENLKYSLEAIRFFEISHNALSRSGVRAVFDRPSPLSVYRHDHHKQVLTVGEFIKPRTNANGVMHALERMMVAEEIRSFLRSHGLEITMAKSVLRETEPFHKYELTEEDLAKIGNLQKRKLLIELVEKIKELKTL